MSDVESGLTLDPGDPRLLELRGVLHNDLGHPGAALIDLNRAAIRGARETLHVPRALALTALGQDDEALENWTRAAEDDPEDPRIYLGRAHTLRRLRLVDRALADIERAAEWSGDNARLLARVTLAYASCLPERPGRFPRWLAHARRTWSAFLANVIPGPRP